MVYYVVHVLWCYAHEPCDMTECLHIQMPRCTRSTMVHWSPTANSRCGTGVALGWHTWVWSRVLPATPRQSDALLLGRTRESSASEPRRGCQLCELGAGAARLSVATWSLTSGAPRLPMHLLTSSAPYFSICLVRMNRTNKTSTNEPLQKLAAPGEANDDTRC